MMSSDSAPAVPERKETMVGAIPSVEGIIAEEGSRVTPAPPGVKGMSDTLVDRAKVEVESIDVLETQNALYDLCIARKIWREEYCSYG